MAAGVGVTMFVRLEWCRLFFTGPRGLLDSTAHEAAPYSLTQSMCRVVKTIEAVETAGRRGGAPKEQSDCVSCKSACMDIDAELALLGDFAKAGTAVGAVWLLGFGDWLLLLLRAYMQAILTITFRVCGAMSPRATSQRYLIRVFIFGVGRIALPKLIAAPLTLAAFAAISYWICMRLERWYRGHLKQKDAADATEKSLHRMFSVCTFLAFNFFFVYGGRPEINHWPVAAQFGFQALIMGVSSLWLSRTWGRSSKQYHIEKMAIKRRQQLQKLSLNVSELLGEQSLNNLSADKLDVLVQVLPEIDRAWQAQYNNVKEDSGDLPRTVIKHRDIRQQDIRQQDIRQQE